ncbi:MAG: TetR/AcrR family transcriptional regulator, partial [Polyangiaceae bacterium]
MGKAERRQQILNAARDVFARRGYHAAKIDEIVATAGIARGTFYLYFEDKRTIFEEIVDRTIARVGMAIVRVDVRPSAGPVSEQVRENIRRIIHILLEDRATTKILLSDALGVDPAFDRKLLSLYDEMSTLLGTSLSEGQALGIVSDGDVRLMSWLMMGALKEVMFQIVQRGAEY